MSDGCSTLDAPARPFVIKIPIEITLSEKVDFQDRIVKTFKRQLTTEFGARI